MDKKQADLIMMYYEFKRLREEEKFSIQRIADYLGFNFRTVKKYLGMTDQEFEAYQGSVGERPCLMEPYKQFIHTYLSEYPDTPAAVIHDRLKEHFPGFVEVNPKTVYNYVMKILCYSRYKFIIFRDSPFTSHSAVEAHEKAFEFFRGIPKEIVYDQDAVFIHDENMGDYLLTDIFDRYRLSRPFKITFCHASDPESKGNVKIFVT